MSGKSAQSSISLIDWALIAVLGFVWGGAFALARISVAEVPPFTISFIRIIAAAGMLMALLPLFGLSMPRDPAMWRRFIPLAVFNNIIPFTLIYWAQIYITAGLGSILNATTPFFAIMLGVMVTSDERFTPGRVFGLVVGFAGVIVAIGPDILGELGTNVLAQAAVLISAVCFAIGGISGRKLRGEPPLVLATGQLLVSAAVLGPASVLIDQPWTLPTPSAAAVWAIVALTLFSTLLAYVLFFAVLERVGATNVLLVTFLQPIAAISLGWLLLGEHLTATQAIGVAGILLGLVAIDGRPARMIRNAFRSSPPSS